MNINEIAKHIYYYSLHEAANTDSGFQIIYLFDDLEDLFGISRQNKKMVEEIFKELSAREEILDLQMDEDGFDMVFGTAYVPGYVEDVE